MYTYVYLKTVENPQIYTVMSSEYISGIGDFMCDICNYLWAKLQIKCCALGVLKIVQFLKIF